MRIVTVCTIRREIIEQYQAAAVTPTVIGTKAVEDHVTVSNGG